MDCRTGRKRRDGERCWCWAAEARKIRLQQSRVFTGIVESTRHRCPFFFVYLRGLMSGRSDGRHLPGKDTAIVLPTCGGFDVHVDYDVRQTKSTTAAAGAITPCRW